MYFHIFFHIFFHLYVFSKNTNNIIRTTLPNELLDLYYLLRLCLVAVKRFPENTYFPEMLISGKGKCFHGVWLHCKKISGKYFLVFGKEKGKLKSENAE